MTDIAPDTQDPTPPPPADAPVAPGAENHLILIDGSGFIFRAFHALPPMTRKDGTPVNAVYGFTNMLARLLQNHEGSHIAVVFDAGRTTFRNELYDKYKAQRPEPPPELVPQFALVRDATAAFGVASLELAGFEADDLIASYCAEATRHDFRTTVVSSDKDLMQLIGDRVAMQDPIKNKPIGTAEVMEKFGVAPALVVEVQALMGDSVDNIPGVPGIGPKTASQLIAEFGTVEAVLAAAPGMKPSKRRDMLMQHADAARISRKLVELALDVPLPAPLDELRAKEPDQGKLAGWLIGMGFRSTAIRYGMKADQAATAEPEPATPDAAPEQPPYGDYPCVTTEAELVTWLAEARRNGILALDAQTDGPDALRATLVGLALATGPRRACYVPLRHRNAAPAAQLALDAPAPEEPPPVPQLDPDTVLALLGPLLRDPAILKVFHDAKYHLLVLERAGLADIAPIDDVMLLSYAQAAGAHLHTRDELAFRNLGHKPAAIESVTGSGRARLPFALVPLPAATGYSAERADVALRLWAVLRPRLRAARSLVLYESQERILVPILMRMEQAGVKVDEAELRRMSADFAGRMETMAEQIGTLAGRTLNIGSPKVVGELLFDEMKLPGGRRTPSGTWGTDAPTLQALADEGHEIPARLLEWRQLSKLRSTYTEALVEEINPDTGRVHTSFAQAATSTGRLSSTDPNLQNIPIRREEGAAIRRAFIAEPGHVLVSCDYSQIELRLMAHVADIAPLKDAFATGQDIHARTASEVFGVPMAGMDGATRRRAKAINFGIIYGISAFGLARQLSIESSEAKTYIDAYFTRYPGIRDYMERTKEEARINGYVLTPFGRRCWVPGIKDKMPQRRAYAERQAINAPLQGGAADIMKLAMVRLIPAMGGLRSRLLLSVHDELLFEAPEDEAAEIAAVAKRVMESAATISVPLVAETGAGTTWAAAH